MPDSLPALRKASQRSAALPLRDLQAGAALGFPAHLVLTGKGRKTLATGGLPEGTKVHDDLRAFSLDFLSTEQD